MNCDIVHASLTGTIRFRIKPPMERFALTL